jgi:hypothetical protein
MKIMMMLQGSSLKNNAAVVAALQTSMKQDAEKVDKTNPFLELNESELQTLGNVVFSKQLVDMYDKVPAEVMSTVVDIMRAFLEKYKGKVTELVFAAKEGSRQGLYARMAKRLLPNWELHQDNEAFRLIAPNQINELMTTHLDHQFKTAYHITNTENAEEILYSGLDPSDGKAFMVVDEGDKAKLQKELRVVGNWMYAKSEGSDDPLTLLQIDVTNMPLAHEHGWYFSTTKIPPNRIRDLGEDELERYV